ncbi:hypothetical protein C2S53_018221 [Perilla frutescens var. hirtella]|uniref:Uncharacterized protein n=1 Tax=Perilla frutescens var. hirtella TaxID=608512 RepID=A0AAD4P4Q8_PERFH|nr:hypothetical protein C2S53_018221 [Perilla frutescens var. hirtella]
MDKENLLKRARDEGDEERDCRRDKKQETICPSNQDSSYENDDDDNRSYEFSEDFGVFDFPWLKEGSLFGFDEFLEPQDMFFGIEDACKASNYNIVDESIMQDSIVLHQDLFDCKFDGDVLCPFRIDDLESLDCVWNHVIDQPLDRH